MSDVTQILNDIEDGDPNAAEKLMPLVYEELRRLAAARMAAEREDHTYQATGLIHEAYVRLVDVRSAQRWANRQHFFAAAAEAMRRILIDHAREKAALKRGGDRRRIDIDAVEIVDSATPVDLLAIDEALDRLSELDAVA